MQSNMHATNTLAVTQAAVTRPAPAPGPAAVAAAGAGPTGPNTPYKLSSSCSRFPKSASKA